MGLKYSKYVRDKDARAKRSWTSGGTSPGSWNCLNGRHTDCSKLSCACPCHSEAGNAVGAIPVRQP